MKTNSTPLRTVLIYAFFSALWILLSDAASNFFIPPDSPNHILAQTIKGWLFVFASASLLYLILSREMKTLQKKQEQIRYQAGLVENVFDAIISTDMQFHIQSWNVAAERMYGWQASEVIGHLMAEFVQNEYISAPRESILKTAMEQGRWQGEVSQNHKNGSRFFVLTSLSMIQDENGQPAGFIAVNHDLTETKRVQGEAAILARFPAENPNPVMRVDLNGRLIYANKASAPLLELWDCGVNGYLPQEYVKQIAASTTSRRNLDDLTCGNRIFSMTIAPIDGENYVNIYAMDITERKRVEAIIRTNETNLSALIENTDGSIWAVDKQYGLIVGNREFHKNVSVVLGRRLEMGESVLLPNFPPQANTEWQGYYDRALQGERFLHETQTRFREAPHYIEYHFSPIREETGEIRGVTIFGRDITERVQAEEKLYESEEKFKYIFDYSMIGKSITQPGGEVNVNQAFCEMLGYSAEELQNKKWRELSHPDDIEMTQKIIVSLLSGERASARFIKRYLHKNGTTVWTDVSSSLRRDQDGKPLYFITSISDITERKKAEEALEWIRTTLAEAQKIAHLGSFEYIAATQITTWSEEEYRIYGLDPSGPSPSYDIMLQKCIHPDDAALLHETFTKAMQSHTAYELEHRVVRPDGSIRWVYDQAHPYFDEQGELIRHIGSTLDITERKKAEEKLHESEERYRTFFENSMDAILLTLPTGMITAANPAACAMFGRTETEITAIGRSGLIDPNDIRLKSILEERAKTGKVSGELTMLRNDGTPFPVELSSALFRDQQGNAHASMIVRDISERKQAQEQLLKTLEELKRSNSELEQFAYVASHDLQEPLRAVAGMVQLLQKRYHGQLDERADEYISLAMDGSNRMQRLITDLLEYSRVDRRGNPIQLTDANEALKSALRNLQEAIQQGGATITNETLPKVEADTTQLTQLLQNLVGNAIKFRSERPPQIHIAVEDLPDAWHFSVHDNGIGIEPQYFERIFLVFQRLHTRREYSGTGIGLSICKKIVERHGGRIWVESKPEQGTTFHFTIPHRS